MRKTILLYSIILTGLWTTAQKPANTWYFGNRAGLDFNQSPPRVLTNSAQSSLEGCSVISDNNGKLLFYTNGLSVMNKKHQEMLNGNNLMGDLGSTCNAIIVPLPGSDSIYYLFTIGAQSQPDKGFRYNIINMNGDGGFGEVVQKNIVIENNVFEKLSAVRHCNKRDVWITIHEGNSDEYHTYLVTAAGISSVPVTSQTGYIPANPIGSLKFSSDGKKLVAVFSFEAHKVELMSFDNTTGVLSTPVLFDPTNIIILPDELFINVYGAEFSPNGRLLYITSNASDTEPSVLYQFDITSNTAAGILASKQVIAVNSPWYAGGLQLGTDQKIYMSNYKDTSLSVIENPDVYGPGCNFMYNKIYMGNINNTPAQFDLPSFIQSYFDPVSNPYDFIRSGNCMERDVSFIINHLSGIDSVKWDFGDGQRSTSLTPIHHFNNPGYYTVGLTVYKVDCSGLNDFINRNIWVAADPYFLGADTGSCSAPTLLLGINAVTGATYEWNTGEISNRITTAAFGSFWMAIEQNGCRITDTVNVYSLPKPVVDIGRDTTVCLNKPVILDAFNTSITAYLWNTGATGPSIKVDHPGIYAVTVTGNSCMVSDSILISWGDCGVFIPNAFTPNGDGINDYFGMVTGFIAKDFLLQVFDRWGNLVFYTSDNSKKWDGRVKGKEVPAGAYSWIMNYTNVNGYKNSMQGSVLLIR